MGTMLRTRVILDHLRTVRHSPGRLPSQNELLPEGPVGWPLLEVAD
jgi:hypothetical protein